MVALHLEHAADEHANPDAQPVTQQHVQPERVPPALREVRQQVRKCHLGAEGIIVLMELDEFKLIVFKKYTILHIFPILDIIP